MTAAMAPGSSLRWLWLSVAIIVLDQYTKWLVTAHLALYESVKVLPGVALTLVHNTGAAFSFLRDAGGWQRWFLIGLSVTVVTGVIIWLARLRGRRRLLACSLAFILGGAAGNLWDRALLGYVIDFIDVYYQHWHWPAFNLADSAISTGAVLLIVDTLWLDRAQVVMDGSHRKDG